MFIRYKYHSKLSTVGKQLSVENFCDAEKDQKPSPVISITRDNKCKGTKAVVSRSQSLHISTVDTHDHEFQALAVKWYTYLHGLGSPPIAPVSRASSRKNSIVHSCLCFL